MSAVTYTEALHNAVLALGKLTCRPLAPESQLYELNQTLLKVEKLPNGNLQVRLDNPGNQGSLFYALKESGLSSKEEELFAVNGRYGASSMVTGRPERANDYKPCGHRITLELADSPSSVDLIWTLLRQTAIHTATNTIIHAFANTKRQLEDAERLIQEHGGTRQAVAGAMTEATQSANLNLGHAYGLNIQQALPTTMRNRVQARRNADQPGQGTPG